MHNSKRTKQLVFAILIALMMMPCFIANVGADVEDLTPEYAKPGDEIPIMSFQFMPPAMGTILYGVNLEYTGTDVMDVEYVKILVNGEFFATTYGTSPPDTVYYTVNAVGELVYDPVTVTVLVGIASGATHLNHVDARVTSYTLYRAANETGTDWPTPGNPLDPDEYTIIDSELPSVMDVSVSQPLIVEDDAGDSFYVTVTYSEEMNPAVEPVISFDPDVSGTLTGMTGAWNLGNDVYTATYTIADVDEEESAIEVSVEDGEDLIGNHQDPYTSGPLFDVDTVKPTVVSATADPDPAKAGDVTVTVEFSEAMDSVPPLVEITGLATSPISVTGYFSDAFTWTETFTLYDDNEETTATISVKNGEDALGNVMEDDTTAGTFTVDTLSPGVVYVTAVPDPAQAELLTVTVVFNETMDTSVTPLVELTGLESSYTVSEDTYTGDTWVGKVTIMDDNEEAVAYIDVRLGQDVAGNVMDPEPEAGSVTIDTLSPEVLDVLFLPQITEADTFGLFIVTVTYSESMNMAVSPTIEFSPTVTGLIPNPMMSNWITPWIYEMYYDILDADEEKLVTVTVTGAEDMIGDDQDPYTSPFPLIVDTVKPTVVSATADPDPAKAGDVTVTVEFSETMSTTPMFEPLVEINGLISSPYTVSGSYSGTTWTGTFTLDDYNEEKTATISVKNGADFLGNVMEDNTTAGTFTVDTDSPTVDDITVSHPVITEINVGDTFEVTVSYDEAMDPDEEPIISFDSDVSSTLIWDTGAWSADDTYTATYTIADVDEEESGIMVSVEWGKDLAGNLQDPNPYTSGPLFDVDTEAPTVPLLTVSHSLITETHVGETFTVTVYYSEPMDAMPPVIGFNPDVSSSFTGMSGGWGPGNVFTATYTIVDDDAWEDDVLITVEDGKDVLGNTQLPYTSGPLFDIDTFHGINDPYHIEVTANYGGPMTLKLNADAVVYPLPGDYSEWNSPTNALVSDDQNAFLTLNDESDNNMTLSFEDPQESYDDYIVTSVTLNVEQKLISDFFALTEDWWEFIINEEDIVITRPGTETEQVLSIDITEDIEGILDSEYEPVEFWEYLESTEVTIQPWLLMCTQMGEWYVDSVWLEVSYEYTAEGQSPIVPVGGEVTVSASVYNYFDNLVPDPVQVTFETDHGTMSPLTVMTDSGVAKTKIISTDVGTATVVAEAGGVEGSCTIMYVTHKLDIELKSGWNLISVPRLLEEPALEDVFEGVTTVEKVYSFQDGAWHAKVYDGTWNDVPALIPIDTIDDGNGYWVYANEPTTITMSLKTLGYVDLTPPDYPLDMGWNMIGYTTMQIEPDMPVNVYLANLDGVWKSLYRFTPAIGYEEAKPPDYGFGTIELCRGYWIYVNEVGVLVP